MKKLIALTLASLLIGCSTPEQGADLEPVTAEPVNPVPERLESIPGQPDKIRLPQQSSGDGNCFAEDMSQPSLESYLGGLDDLVWGQVSHVEMVLDRIEGKSGEIISLAECELGVGLTILRVTLTEAHSLFHGPLGSMEFYIPSGAFEGWRSQPHYFHQGLWRPLQPHFQDGEWIGVGAQPARIDGSLGWSRAEAGVQVDQELVVSLLLNDEGHLVSNRLPIYELFNDEYVATGWDGNFVDRDRTSCFRFPAPLDQPFTIDALQTAYAQSGRTVAPFGFELGPLLTKTTPLCLYPEPPREPVPESDMGNP